MSHWPKPHHGMVSEYQASGVPFITSSQFNEVGATTPVSVTFPFVTRWVVVHNTDKTTGDYIRWGFTSNGVKSVPNANYMLLDGGEITPRLEVKCSQLWFLADDNAKPASFSVVAGLTNVPIDQFFAVTGSNGVAGVG